jgi:hypothetical protein
MRQRSHAGGFRALRLSTMVILFVGVIGLSSSLLPQAQLTSSTTATTLYASATATGTGTCATAANACTLGTALRDVDPGDTIDLVTPGTSGSYDGTFTVATSGTSASYPITIQPAPGVANPTLNGQSKGSVLIIGGGVYVNLTGVTITGGHAGTSGDSPITNGGGIYNIGTLTVTDSTISQNFAFFDGGGMYSSGTATIIDSTISDNSAGIYGGGIFNASTTTIIHSTISGDVSHYGAGVGIYNLVGTVNLAADLLATVGGPPSGGECAGTITDLGYNVADDSSCHFTNSTSVVSTSADKLGPLANNGGPTETILPLSGNPAIGLIPPTTSVAINGTSVALCPTTDQRGVASPSGANCDAGSVEVLAQTIHFTSTAPTHPIVVSSTYTPTASSTSGLPVTITIASTSSSVCSINTSGVVTFTASGTCVIDANQAGNTTYVPAPEVTQSISVVGPPTPIPTHPSPVSKPASTLDTVPNAAITYPNGALIQSGQQIDVIAGGYAFGIPTPAMMNKITKADTSTVVTGTFPTTTTPTPGTLINPVGTPGYWVVGTNGEIYAFSSMSQFTSDGYLLSQVVPVPNTGGLVVHAGTPPTAAMTMANGALVQYGTTIYEYAGQVPTGIQTPAQLAEIQRITGAVVLKGSGTTPTAATTSANGTLVHPLGTDGIWVSDGHVLYQFTSPSQFTTDGYASRYVLPVATLGTYTKSAI